MLLTTILVAAIFATSQFRITHSSFTHAPGSKLGQFRHPLQDASQPGQNLKSSPLEKRDPPEAPHLKPRVLGTLAIENHWTVALDTFNSFPNDAPATEILMGFYAAIEAHASALQTQLTQLPAVSFQLGEVELVFFSAIGNVPWSFVRNFAVLMQAVTARGIAGFFKARGVHLSGVTVFVDLRLI
ncbi:MAG: hypothetical protein HETSPECPRED_005036 [Heterodermia speciosa]|uniref:Uncharacterized protein n=1 Tax=Heterodermia speciosa TaxID=116794 RepID=A0A8H3IQK1_9LECA|nr:MAG: hypothetical protein HETSPECPRED_005036 [Heterodermia speciosa]